MSQFRKDIFSDSWIMISPERGLEASVFGSVLPTPRSPLSPGNEHAFGTELRALRPETSPPNSPDWQIRVVSMPDALVEPQTFVIEHYGFYQQATSYGYQEMIIEHPDAQMMLETMPQAHLIAVLKMYRDRLAYIASKPDIVHVQLKRSVGRSAGALYDHPHAQVLGLPVANRWLEEERRAADVYLAREGDSLFQAVWRFELEQRERVITHNDAFIALAPFASKKPFEVWIMPKHASSSFANIASNVVPQLADIMQTVLAALNSALNYPPYAMLLHTLPHANAEGYDWHIKILPRLTQSTGFDWGTGFYVNPTPPEHAARFLREAISIQGVVQ